MLLIAESLATIESISLNDRVHHMTGGFRRTWTLFSKRALPNLSGGRGTLRDRQQSQFTDLSRQQE